MTQAETRTSLGPLELAGGRWVVGDSGRPKGRWVEFRPDGLFQHEPGEKRAEGEAEGEGAAGGLLIPWSRIMTGMRLTLGAKYPARGSYGLGGLLDGLPGPWRGHGSGYLHMTLRHPYENWVARFHRHPRHYRGMEIVLLQALMTQVVQTDRARLLGDPEWLGRVVARLAPQRPWGLRAVERAVTAALAAEAEK
ncbi:hypothetical protein [Streptomyces anandii]|uniref:hypothetical protein n=1 Tax=Streptomyces anandii TaxID=285454 RepID=UPI0019878AD1|nr:hypothetical protein [Streptomyces anandii]GGX86245.1 hypothetical protein GCM10010510_34210 [Streptomyces anandii JCM 4720]